MTTSHAYTLDIETEADNDLLYWLHARGYAAGILDHAEDVDLPEGSEIFRRLGFCEPSAWQVHDEYADDPGAFMACCGSSALYENCQSFIDSIV